MRRATALVSATLAVCAASCDFEYAYQQYCESNPACEGDAGTLAPDGSPDASGPDASRAPDGSCDPGATSFSDTYGPSTCDYGEVCTSEQACATPDSHCLTQPVLPDDYGPVIFDVRTKVSLVFCPRDEMPVRVEGRFYAPMGIGGELWGHFWPPPGPGPASPDCLAQVHAEYPSDRAIIGDFVSEACCPNPKPDFKRWVFELSDETFLDSHWGTVVCLP